ITAWVREGLTEVSLRRRAGTGSVFPLLEVGQSIALAGEVVRGHDHLPLSPAGEVAPLVCGETFLLAEPVAEPGSVIIAHYVCGRVEVRLRPGRTEKIVERSPLGRVVRVELLVLAESGLGRRDREAVVRAPWE